MLLLPKELSESIFIKGSFWILTAHFAILLWALYQIKNRIKLDKITFFKATVFSIFLVCLIARSYPPTLKVLSDEANLLSVSHSFLDINKAVIKNMGYPQTGQGAIDIATAIPTRPLTHSYMTYALHALTGYRITNIILVNIFLFLLVLIVLFVFVSQLTHSSLGGAGACLALVSHPLIPFYVTSGSFDISSFSFFFFTSVSYYFYLKEKDSRLFTLFIVLLSLFAFIRYEATLIASIFFISAFISKGFSKEDILKSKWIFLFLLLPFFLVLTQRSLSQNDMWPIPADKYYFSFENFYDNIKILLRALLNPTKSLPYSFLNIAFLSLFIFIFLAKKLRSFGDNALNKQVLIPVGISTLAYFIFFLSFYFGSFTMDVTHRYFLLPLAISSLFLYFLMHNSLNKIKNKESILFIFFLSFFFFESSRAHEIKSGSAALTVEFDKLTAFAKNHSSNDLYIYDKPVFMLVQPRDCVNFEYFKKYTKYFFDEQKKGRWQNIWAIQYWNNFSKVPVDPHKLNPEISFIEAERFPSSNKDHDVRIMKLVSKE